MGGTVINTPGSKRQGPCAQMWRCYEIIFGPQWGERGGFEGHIWGGLFTEQHHDFITMSILGEGPD